MFVNLWAKTERKFYWNIPLYTNIPSYLLIFGKSSIFSYISRSCHWEVLYKILVGRAAFLLKLLAVRMIQTFSRFFRKWFILYDKFCRHIQKFAFFVWNNISRPIYIYPIYLDFQKWSLGSAIKVFVKPLKTIFDEGHFIVNLLYQVQSKMEVDLVN